MADVPALVAEVEDLRERAIPALLTRMEKERRAVEMDLDKLMRAVGDRSCTAYELGELKDKVLQSFTKHAETARDEVPAAVELVHVNLQLIQVLRVLRTAGRLTPSSL